MLYSEMLSISLLQVTLVLLNRKAKSRITLQKIKNLIANVSSINETTKDYVAYIQHISLNSVKKGDIAK